MSINFKAVVLGSKGVNATGLIRSLGMADVYVIFASTYSKIESKYTKEYLHLPNDKNKWIDILNIYTCKNEGKAAIFPSDDETAFWLDENYENLRENYIVPNAHRKLKTIADKAVMSQMAKAAGLAVPYFAKISLREQPKAVDFPVILKPFAGYAGSKGDISICRSKGEYVRASERLLDKGYKEILVQRLLDSREQEEIGLMGMALPGEKIVIPGIIHKIRSYPTGKGSTSYAKFEPGTEDLDIEKIKRFVCSTGYIGLFDIEMIKSKGVYYFIEINYRNGQYGYTPTAAGYNLPYNWIKGMTAEKIDDFKNLKSVFYINERDDFHHVKNGEIGLKDWIKQFNLATAYGMFCKGDQRPFIRQYVKIPDRVSIGLHKVAQRLRGLLIKEEWSIAIRKKEGNFLWEEGSKKRPFRVLKNTLRYWAADPFIISKDDKDYLFFEMFDRFKGKGVIGYREISDGKIGKMKIAYQAVHHLSFPYIFVWKENYYIMPEYSEGEKLFILKASHFPDVWEETYDLITGKRLVDSVLLKKDNSTYLFTQELKSGYSFDELCTFIKKGESWVGHPLNPLVKTPSNARLGGKIFFAKNKLIRVAQDCKTEYGKRLNFNEILVLDEENFNEKIISTIAPDDISTDTAKRFYGIHTYNFNDKYEVIDLKNKSKVELGNIINVFLKIIKRLKR